MENSSIVPNHLGLILDGNRRWAKAHGLSTLDGHQAGYRTLKEITKHAVNSGVKFVTAFIFSTENWTRTPREVKYLMDLTLKKLVKDVDELNKENIRIMWLGSKDKLSKKLLQAIDNAETLTSGNKKGTLCFCFNYGGAQEIVDAINQIITSDDSRHEITIEILEKHLYKPEIPPVDLTIRTSGEHRISGFMLYRVAYSELYFSDIYWPDFKTDDLDDAFHEYSKRQRRFGK